MPASEGDGRDLRESLRRARHGRAAARLPRVLATRWRMGAKAQWRRRSMPVFAWPKTGPSINQIENLHLCIP